MGALYHLKQRLVDFANVVQENLNRSDTVPSSKVLHDETTEIKESLSALEDGINGTITMQSGYTLQGNSYAKRYGNRFEVRLHLYSSAAITASTNLASVTFDGKRFPNIERSVGVMAQTQNSQLNGVITGYLTAGGAGNIVVGDYISTANPKEVEIYFSGFLADA